MSEGPEGIATVEHPQPEYDLSNCVLLCGPSASGKSGFLGGLYQIHQDVKPRGRRSDVHWMFPPERNATTDIPLQAWRQLRRREVAKTPMTDPEGTYQPREVTLAMVNGAGHDVAHLKLVLVDPPGEDMTERLRRELPVVGRLRRAAASARAIIWLIPARPRAARSPDEDRMWVLHNVTAILDEAKRDTLEQVPLAVCLSMIDLLDEEQREAAKLDPYGALKEQVGERTLRWLEAAFPNMKTFAISAAGVLTPAEEERIARMRRQAADPIVGGGAEDWADGVPVRPINLADVMDWVHQQIGSAESSGQRVDLGERIAEICRSLSTNFRSAKVRRWMAVALAAMTITVMLALASMRALRVGPTGSVPPMEAEASPATHPTTHVRPAVAPAFVGNTLDQARAAGRRQDWNTVLILLSDTLPTGSPMVRTWDSLAAAAAVREAGRRSARGGGTDLYRLARLRAARVIDSDPPGSTFLSAPLRVLRAQACIDGRIQCPVNEIQEDLTVGALTSDPGVRAQIRALRTRWTRPGA